MPTSFRCLDGPPNRRKVGVRPGAAEQDVSGDRQRNGRGHQPEALNAVTQAAKDRAVPGWGLRAGRLLLGWWNEGAAPGRLGRRLGRQAHVLDPDLSQEAQRRVGDITDFFANCHPA